jgi:hypothetical protein
MSRLTTGETRIKEQKAETLGGQIVDKCITAMMAAASAEAKTHISNVSPISRVAVTMGQAELVGKPPSLQLMQSDFTNRSEVRNSPDGRNGISTRDP